MTLPQLLARDKHYSRLLAAKGNGRTIRLIAWVLARTGDSLFWLLIVGVLLWQRHPLGWQLLAYVAITAAIVAVAKGIFRRHRPSGPGRAIATDKYAFPSGHAARVGALSILLSTAFPPVTGLWLVWAILVSLARVVLARHYLTDVVGGLVLGITIGLVGTAVT